MPRVFLTAAAQAAFRAREAEDAMLATVLLQLQKLGMTKEELASKMGLTRVTLRRRMRAPEDFTLKELRRLAAAVGLTEAETKGLIV